MTVWLNGALVPADEARVSVRDHGLTTGDGVFEALKVTGGVPFAVTRHLARLRASAAGMGLPEPDLDRIRAGVARRAGRGRAAGPGPGPDHGDRGGVGARLGPAGRPDQPPG